MSEALLINSKGINSKIKRGEKLNLILFLEGKLVSLLGTNLYGFILALYILNETGSALSFSFNILASMLPRIILGPFAGILADKVERKKIVVSLDFLSGLVVFGLLFISYSFGLKISYIYITTILLSIISTFFDTAISASIPNLVTEKKLMKINSYAGAITSLSSIIAPVLGGILFGLISINLFLLINAISFICSAVSEIFINFQLVKPENTVEEKIENHKEKVKIRVKLKAFYTDIKEVFIFIKNKKDLYILMKFALIMNLAYFACVIVILPYVINNVLNMTSVQFGIIEAAFSIGYMIASIIIAAIPEKNSKLKSFTLGIFMMGICVAAIGIPTIPILSFIHNNVIFIVFIVINVVLAVSMVVVNMPLMVSIQKSTPDYIRGRVMAMLGTISGGIAPLGIILTGLVIGSIPSYIIPVVSGIIIMICSLMIGKNKAMKEF